ncbi:hypothetical protein ACFPME_04405 [Rhodanobacter umsongensis]|uniref:Uncharacterized protein n=1 Tax=Rhodanobacter umsongensis TaxID=633153 RepID=A0ABW0JK08_9GAMM
MRFRLALMASTWLIAAAATAQVAPATSSQNDSWAARPAVASSAGFRGHSAVEATPARSHFKFKDRQRPGPADQPPPSATDKAAVMGTDRAWQNGRPPVDCAQAPMDATCRH